MMDSAALDKVLDEIGYVSKEALEKERKLREEACKKAFASLYGDGVAPESISAAYGIPIAEVLMNLGEWLTAHPREPGQSS